LREAVRYRPPGDAGTGRDRWTVLIVFWGAFVLVCVAAVVVVVIREIEPAPPSCPPPPLCPGPPPVIPVSRLRTFAVPDLGVRLQYPVRVFAATETHARSLKVRLRAKRPDGVEASIWISVQRGRDAVPQDLLATRENQLGASILGLTPDDDPRTIIPPPHIGPVAGIGGSYRGTVDTAQGPQAPVVAILAAATNRRAGIVVSYVVSGTEEPAEIARLRTFLSPVLTSVTWEA
jgi:hypothetical protein